MELFLNSAWALVGVAIVCLWLRLGRRDKADNRLSLGALVMLLVILFPVISVSDDLWSIQNPAETSTCQRRDYLASCSHSIFPTIAALPEPAFGEPSFGCQRFQLPSHSPSLSVDNPAIHAIQNCPPPSV